ncbi:hypothetical protein D3C84_1023020 [compost metagenome]
MRHPRPQQAVPLQALVLLQLAGLQLDARQFLLAATAQPAKPAIQLHTGMFELQLPGRLQPLRP